MMMLLPKLAESPACTTRTRWRQLSSGGKVWASRAREEVRGSEKVVGSNTEDCWSWVLVGLSCRDESGDERGDT